MRRVTRKTPAGPRHHLAKLVGPATDSLPQYRRWLDEALADLARSPALLEPARTHAEQVFFSAGLAGAPDLSAEARDLAELGLAKLQVALGAGREVTYRVRGEARTLTPERAEGGSPAAWIRALHLAWIAGDEGLLEALSALDLAAVSALATKASFASAHAAALRAAHLGAADARALAAAALASGAATPASSPLRASATEVHGPALELVLLALDGDGGAFHAALPAALDRFRAYAVAWDRRARTQELGLAIATELAGAVAFARRLGRFPVDARSPYLPGGGASPTARGGGTG